MARWNVLIYDGNDGQLRAGLGPWEQMGEWKRESLLTQDLQAAEKVRSLDELFAGVDVEYREVSTYEEAFDAIGEADILAVCKGRIDAALLERAPKLREVHLIGFDLATVDVEALQKRNIPLKQVPLTNFLAVAEHTMALILGLNKRLAEAHRRTKGGEDWMVIPGNFRLLRDMTIGILGVGEIGLQVAKLLQPWGATLLYHDIRQNLQLEKETGATCVSWQEIFEKSDVLTVHLPLNEQTEGIVGAQEFAWMKPDALLINTARGKVVDEGALYHALRTGRIGGAGLDVFAEEPLPTNSDLHELDNVILTPHVAWAGPFTLVNDVNNLIGGVAEALRQME